MCLDYGIVPKYKRIDLAIDLCIDIGNIRINGEVQREACDLGKFRRSQPSETCPGESLES